MKEGPPGVRVMDVSFTKDLVRCDEILTRQLLAMDLLELGGQTELRTRRKALIAQVETAHATLDKLRPHAKPL